MTTETDLLQPISGAASKATATPQPVPRPPEPVPPEPVPPEPLPLGPLPSEALRAGETLDFRFFAHYTVLRHERPEDFEKLVLEINASYEPKSRAEELTVFRMAQVFWLLRRLDAAENAVYASLAELAKQRDELATGTGATAAFFLKPDESVEARFARRMLSYRALHETTLDRLTGQLLRLKTYREAAGLRAVKADLMRTRAFPAAGSATTGRFTAMPPNPESASGAGVPAG